jgi:hypothetical protein
MSSREREPLRRLWSTRNPGRLVATLGVLLLLGSAGSAQGQSITITTITAGSTGGAPAQVTVTVSPTATSAVSVQYATSDGAAPTGAIAGQDYQPASGSLVFAPGVASQTIDVTSITTSSTTVYFNLTLSNAVNANLMPNPSIALVGVSGGGGGGGPPPPTTVQFSLANYSVSESAGQANITVTLSGSAAGTVTVPYSTSDGTAIAGTDYMAASGTLTLAAGQISQNFSVAIIDTKTVGGSKTVNLALGAPTGATAGSPSTATLTIMEDDLPPPTVQFSLSYSSVSESAGQANIAATLSAATTGTVTVPYSTSDGTAVAGTDYSAASGTLTFTAGQTSQNFSVPIIDTKTAGGSKTVNLALGAPTGATLGVQSTATLTIMEDDPPPPTVQFAFAAYAASESAGQANIAVTLSTATTGTVTVPYSTSDGTAVAGTDYMVATGTLTFAAGQTSQNFSVSILDTKTVGGSKTLNLALGAPTGATAGSPSTAMLTIMDDDPPLPTVQFSQPAFTALKTDGFATITVTASPAPQSSISVQYATQDGTGPDAAIAPGDYTSTSGTLAFAAGQTTQTFQVAVVCNTASMPDKMLNLILTIPMNATLGSPSTATLTIHDAVPILALQRVAFSGNGNYFDVTADDGDQLPFSAPQWLDNDLNGSTDDPGDCANPVCYLRNTSMQVSATWQVTTAGPVSGNILFQGIGPATPDGAALNIPQRSVSMNGSSSASIPATQATNPFQDAMTASRSPGNTPSITGRRGSRAA